LLHENLGANAANFERTIGVRAANFDQLTTFPDFGTPPFPEAFGSLALLRPLVRFGQPPFDTNRA